MVDPEFPGGFIGAGQGQRVAHGMAEKGGVKVAAAFVSLTEFHPLGKMHGLQFVSVRPLTFLEDGIGGVKIHLGSAGNQLQHHVEICHQLLGSAGTAGIVAGGLYSAGEGLTGVSVETAYIVTLPAVQGNRNGAELCHGGVCVNAKSGIFCFCFCITHFTSSNCIFRLPIAVASIGRAITFFPVASSVSRFRKAFLAPPPTM